MQMGFNNDVPYKDLILHIQTEDHGLSTKKITSQVFFSGAILESRTISYEDEIAGIEGDHARDERVRTIMKALHRKFYQRIQEGTYDERLPIEEGAVATEHLEVGASVDGVGLETPEDLLADEGFTVAGEQAEIPEQVALNSRGEPMDAEELKAHALEDMVDEITVAAQSLGEKGFVQMGGVGSGSHESVGRQVERVDRPAPSVSADIEIGDVDEVLYGARRAWRGLDADHSDIGPLLLSALRGA